MPMRFPFRPSSSYYFVAFLLPLFGACGGTRDLGIDQPADAGVEESIVIKVDWSAKQQTLEGFGASAAWYAEWFTQHPNREALARILFHDLGFDILRLRNQHRTPGDSPDPAGVAVYRAAEGSLGRAPRVMLTSWSPPAELKSSGRTRCETTDTDATCTLRLDPDGSFPYAAFADYWADSIEAYRAQGVEPHYVSIQNEPDFKPGGWEGCRFNATESANLPGYDRALDAVSKRFAESGLTARLLGPETAQLQNGAALRYSTALDASPLYGIAHHLYDGSAWKSPNAYSSAMTALADAFPNLPKFQTEFSPTESGAAVEGGFEVAWLIHNSIAVERASAYLHWELFWPTSGLVAISNPSDTSKWTSNEGYKILEPYYAVRHFARYSDPGDSVVSSLSNSSDILATAYLSPDESRLTVVMLNVSKQQQDFTLDLSGFPFASSLSFITTDAAAWQPGVPVESLPTQELQMAPRSIVTIVVSRATTVPE